MKVIGPMTDAMAKAMSTFPMAILTRASTGRAKYGAKGSTYGKAESSTRASGLKDTRRATESGRESLVTTMSVSGEQTSHTGLESILGVTRTSTKVNGKPASDTDKAWTSLLLEINIWVSTAGVRLKASGSIDGPTEMCILVNSTTA